METNVLSGLLLILLAGSCSGVFSVPFKFNRGWAWENNWFIWSFAALLVMPWLMAWLTVPRLGTLYGADPHSTSSVSYTHLDVYKRQVRGLSGWRQEGSVEEGAGADEGYTIIWLSLRYSRGV